LKDRTLTNKNKQKGGKMELCLNVLAELLVVLAGTLIYVTASGNRLGFDPDKPRQPKKIAFKGLGMFLITAGIVGAFLQLLDGGYWDLPFSKMFTLMACVFFCAGILIAFLTERDSHWSLVRRLFVFPSLGISYAASIYFVIVLLLLKIRG
jgi:hypothetical protein